MTGRFCKATLGHASWAPFAPLAHTHQVCVPDNESLVLGRVLEAVDFSTAIRGTICLQTATVDMALRKPSFHPGNPLACQPSSVLPGTTVDDGTYNDQLQWFRVGNPRAVRTAEPRDWHSPTRIPFWTLPLSILIEVVARPILTLTTGHISVYEC